MMRVISVNLNGIRAAARKGFYDWLPQQNADFVCLQEIRAHMKELTDDLYRPKGYHCYFVDADKKGYSGVGIYTKQKPLAVTTSLGWECADTEGRYIQVDFSHVSIVSIYFPSGSSKEERQALKIDFMDRYQKILKKQMKSGRQFIICGDWNIVHTEKDIKNFKANQKNSGCLPEERAWLDRIFSELGWVDAFRQVNQEADQYTWWSNRGRAWDNNVGWRIDYQVTTPEMGSRVRTAHIYKDQRFSDHAPLVIDYAEI